MMKPTPDSTEVNEPVLEFLKIVHSLGVERGDCLLVHSNITTLLHAGLTVRGVINCILDVIGDDGTLILPTFNLDWCKGEDYDYLNTPSQMGLLTESARLDPRFVRTAHPIQSFAVAGRHKDAFTAYDHPSTFGVGSGFEILHRLDGKIMVIGLPWQDSMTFLHYVEETERVPYRYFKAFPGWYRDGKGNVTKREYFLYVRDLETGVETYLHDAEEHFLGRGLAKECNALGTHCTLVGAAVLYEETVKQLRINPQFLHRLNAAGAG